MYLLRLKSQTISLSSKALILISYDLSRVNKHCYLGMCDVCKFGHGEPILGNVRPEMESLF